VLDGVVYAIGGVRVQGATLHRLVQV